MAMFLRGTNSHALSWHLTSIGIRKAQDVGAHRRTVYHAKPNVVEELWKRAFWLLLGFDRIGSATLGRTCNVGEEEFVHKSVCFSSLLITSLVMTSTYLWRSTTNIGRQKSQVGRLDSLPVFLRALLLSIFG